MIGREDRERDQLMNSIAKIVHPDEDNPEQVRESKRVCVCFYRWLKRQYPQSPNLQQTKKPSVFTRNVLNNTDPYLEYLNYVFNEVKNDKEVDGIIRDQQTNNFYIVRTGFTERISEFFDNDQNMRFSWPKSKTSFNNAGGRYKRVPAHLRRGQLGIHHSCEFNIDQLEEYLKNKGF